MINTILNLLRADGFITVNKTLACNIGLVPATVFCELSSKFNYFYNKGQLKDGFFYCTAPELKKDTGLSKDEQSTAIKKLIKFGLIEMQVKKLKGDECPKRYFKIVSDLNNLLKYLTSVEETGKEENPISTLENPILEVGISATNKNKNKTTNNISQSVDLDIPKIENLNIDAKEEIHKIIFNAQVDLYQDDIKILIKECINDIYTNTSMPMILKMGMNQEQIKNKIKLLQYIHIDRAISKLREAQAIKGVKNIKLYMCKCLLSAISEVGIIDLINNGVED